VKFGGTLGAKRIDHPRFGGSRFRIAGKDDQFFPVRHPTVSPFFKLAVRASI
jgi:hypothetical protein